MTDYQPVIVIGAPRSGTNIIRDILTRHPECGTWPCDEINYIWRHKNSRYPTDSLSVTLATPEVQDFIRKAFEKQRLRQEGSVVVEKTCANSLRVPFVNAVIPEARYIFITRNGKDVVASAMKRWRASFNLPYIVRKARFVPLTDIPHYATRFILDRAQRLLSQKRQAPVWGPRFPGMDEILRKDGLPGVCAAQWATCVRNAEAALSKMPGSRVYRIRYEDFAVRPAAIMQEATKFLNLDPCDWTARTADVSQSSIGKGSEELPDSILPTIEKYINLVSLPR